MRNPFPWMLPGYQPRRIDFVAIKRKQERERAENRRDLLRGAVGAIALVLAGIVLTYGEHEFKAIYEVIGRFASAAAVLYGVNWFAREVMFSKWLKPPTSNPSMSETTR